jgi:hypothetical protein
VATAFARLPLSEQLDLLLGGGTHAAPSATRASGDLVVRSASLQGHGMVMAAFDWTRSRGSIGPAEATQLGEALALAATRGVPLVFLMNTSGMRVTEGMQTVVALRTLLRGVLDARLAGQRMYALVTHHAFGGASILASLCQRRTMHADAILAMSGPKLIERIAGRGALMADDPAAVRALLGGRARVAMTGTTEPCDDSAEACRAALSRWLSEPAASAVPDVDAWCRDLRVRLGMRALRPLQGCSIESLDDPTRRTLDRLLGDVAEVRRSGDLIAATAPRPDAPLVLGLVGGGTATAPLALALTEQVLAIGTAPRAVAVLADIENHSADPADERVVLSEYLALLALALRVAQRRGHDVRVIVTGVSGGGIFAALAAGASRVEMLPEARIQVLSPEALAAIGQQAVPEDESATSAIRAGAVDALFEDPSPA